jgi:hypothetical protein
MIRPASPPQPDGTSSYTVGLLPLDARPVCDAWPRLVAAFAGWPLVMPPRNLLQTEHLKTPVPIDLLMDWMAQQQAPDAWVWSTDLIAYGGLIPSRLGFEDAATCQQRLTQAIQAMAGTPGYAFSSVLRLPNYNNAEEEPDYWACYGQALYQYSVRQAQGLRPFTKELPDSVVQDFLRRRARNFSVNQWLMAQQSALATPALHYLVFCQDDTGPVGLNVNEAQTLAQQLPPNQGLVKTGADELAVCLMLRAQLVHAGLRPKVAVLYGDLASQTVVMPFDGVPLADIVNNTLALCHAESVDTPEAADIVWLIHAGCGVVGDHMEGRLATNTSDSLHAVQQHVQQLDKPLCLADVAYANGGDPDLTNWLVQSGKWQGLTGYAAWNTPGNSLGSSLSMGLAHWLGKRQHTLNNTLFQQALLTRLLDDGIYQGILRTQGRSHHTQITPDASLWLMMAFEPYLSQLGLDKHQLHMSWPCQRWFELDIKLYTRSGIK